MHYIFVLYCITWWSHFPIGVIGVLEANFIEPTHNKQDFEKTPAFQKLEARLKDMTQEYWLVINLQKKKENKSKV